MFLPDDILSLIYSYAYYPLPAHWVNIDKLCKDPYSLIASNIAGLPWTKKNYEFLRNIYNNRKDNPANIFDEIASIKSPNLLILWELGDILQELVESPNASQYSLSNPYIYKHLPEEQKDLSLDRLCKSMYLLTGLWDLISSPCFDIREQRNIIYRLLENPGFMDYGLKRYLAKYPQYWDIFLTVIGDQERTDYYPWIAANPCEQAISIIASDPEHFLSAHPQFMRNPGAYPIIKELIEKNKINCRTIGVEHLSSNPNPQVINLLKLHLDLVRDNICSNSLGESVDIILANPRFINWDYISSNTNPRIIPLLKANYSKLDYTKLSSNPLIFPKRIFTRKVISKTRKYLLDGQINMAQEAKAKIEQANELINKLNTGYFN